jgi:DNA repair protein RecO
LESAFSLFSHIECSKILFAMSEILCKSIVEGQNEEEVFRLIKASIDALKKEAPPKWIFYYFLFWFLKLQGVLSAPRFCGKCKAATAPFAFLKDEGGWLCKNCYKEGGFVISPESVEVLNHLFSKPPGDLLEVKTRQFPKELATMLYFNIYHFVGSDIQSLRIGM